MGFNQIGLSSKTLRQLLNRSTSWGIGNYSEEEVIILSNALVIVMPWDLFPEDFDPEPRGKGIITLDYLEERLWEKAVFPSWLTPEGLVDLEEIRAGYHGNYRIILKDEEGHQLVPFKNEKGKTYFYDLFFIEVCEEIGIGIYGKNKKTLHTYLTGMDGVSRVVGAMMPFGGFTQKEMDFNKAIFAKVDAAVKAKTVRKKVTKKKRK